ncbi:methyltransferase domain-containing protein [Candidatus Sumerlaeota bacterium]|nr:methyltransferase domain-containing protein [Candidatus Sumerlaeota bacterium]
MSAHIWHLLYRLCPIRRDFRRSRFDKLLCEAMRRDIAGHLRGRGLEIGAQTSPFPVNPSRARVEHADIRTPEDQSRRHRFDLKRLVSVDHLLPPGGSLHAIPSESFDFLVAAHVLEHIWDIRGTIEDWKRVIREGGHLALVLPDRRWNVMDHRISPSDPGEVISRCPDEGRALRDHLLRLQHEATGLVGEALEARVDTVIANEAHPHLNQWTCEEFLALVGLHPAFHGLHPVRWWHLPRAFEFGVLFERRLGAHPCSGPHPPRWPGMGRVTRTLLSLIRRKVTRRASPRT